MVNLCIPVGTTIMMDGAALYEASAVIFLAQMETENLGFYKCVSLGTRQEYYVEHFSIQKSRNINIIIEGTPCRHHVMISWG